MSSNIKPKNGSKESPAEPFKRAVAGCMRAIARMHPATARLNGSVGDSFDGVFGLTLVDIGRYESATFTELSGSSTPKQR